MRKLTQDEQNELLKRFNNEFCYENIVDEVRKSGDLSLYKNAFNMKNRPYKIYEIDEYALDNLEWENAVNDVIASVTDDEIYCLDYHHEYFEFNPSKNRIKNNWFYFPNGDEYFFVSKDFSFGIFTLPPNAMIVFGSDLLKAIKKNKKKLFLTDIETFQLKKKEIQKNIDKINKYVNDLGWFDYQINKIEQNVENDLEYDVELFGGFDIDLPGYETAQILFKKVQFISANLAVQYSWINDEKQLFLDIAEDEIVSQKFPELEKQYGKFMFRVMEKMSEKDTPWVSFWLYAEDIEFKINEGIKKWENLKLKEED